MSKLLLSAIVLAVIIAPTGIAQQNHTIEVEILELPASGMTNGTSLVVPFKVHATVNGAPPCLNQDGEATYTIALAAEVTDTTGNDGNATTANVNPRQITIAAPILLPSVGGARAERTEDATLVVNAAPYTGDLLNATVRVTATFVSSNGGCTGLDPAPAASAQEDFRAGFEPVPAGFGDGDERGNELPGPAFALTLLALVALAMVVRRFS